MRVGTCFESNWMSLNFAIFTLVFCHTLRTLISVVQFVKILKICGIEVYALQTVKTSSGRNRERDNGEETGRRG